MGSGTSNKINDFVCNPKDVKKKKTRDLKNVTVTKYSHCFFLNTVPPSCIVILGIFRPLQIELDNGN